LKEAKGIPVKQQVKKKAKKETEETVEVAEEPENIEENKSGGILDELLDK